MDFRLLGYVAIAVIVSSCAKDASFKVKGSPSASARQY